MKRIEKGPVRGISLRLQEEVSKIASFDNPTLGKRKKDGFHPREVRDPNLPNQIQGLPHQGVHQRPRNQGPHQRPQIRQGLRWVLSTNTSIK